MEVREGEKLVAVWPSDEFRITCRTDYNHPLAGAQQIEMEVSSSYSSEIAPARTFGFEDELDRMRDMGLIRGACLDNAVCFTRDGVLNPGGLRFPDECCRHKVLDLIGDLALIGRPILGHVIAQRAGHAMHAALVNKIMHDPSCYELVGWKEAAAKREPVLVGRRLGQTCVQPLGGTLDGFPALELAVKLGQTNPKRGSSLTSRPRACYYNRRTPC